MFNRRTVSAKLAGAVVAPSFAFAKGGKVVAIPAGLSAFRVGADGHLAFVRKYDLDVGACTRWWSGVVALA